MHMNLIFTFFFTRDAGIHVCVLITVSLGPISGTNVLADLWGKKLKQQPSNLSDVLRF